MGLRPLRDVPAEERLPAPELLPIADSQEEAEKRLAEALGFTDERQRIVETPMGSRVIRRELLAHMVEKRSDARERFASYVLPTLQQPFEIWAQATRRREARRIISAISGGQIFIACRRADEPGRLPHMEYDEPKR